MAFVCTVTDEEIRAEYFAEGDSHVLFVYVGFDRDRGVKFFISVGLEPMAGGFLEYYFNLIERDLETDSERVYWSGRDLPVSMTGHDRALILKAVMQATRYLLDMLRPTWVFRCTRDGYASSRGLEKHELISHVFVEAGYRLHVADPFGDKRCWWMERENQS